MKRLGLLLRVNEFAVPVLTGQAIISMTDEDEETRSGRDGESDGAFEIPFKTMSSPISEESFMDMWRQEMRDMHAPPADLEDES